MYISVIDKCTINGVLVNVFDIFICCGSLLYLFKIQETISELLPLDFGNSHHPSCSNEKIPDHVKPFCIKIWRFISSVNSCF